MKSLQFALVILAVLLVGVCAKQAELEPSAIQSGKSPGKSSLGSVFTKYWKPEDSHARAAMVETQVETQVDATPNDSSSDDTDIADAWLVTFFVLTSVISGLTLAIYYAYVTSLIVIQPGSSDEGALLNKEIDRVHSISECIAEGAEAFLWAEYQTIAVFVAIFSVFLFVIIGICDEWQNAFFTLVAYWVGSATSVVSGYIGMKIAVYANSRTAIKSQDSLKAGFQTSFKAGTVMGFSLVSLGVLSLWLLCVLYSLKWQKMLTDMDSSEEMFECIAGFGLGGSSIALFGRVGGGIYTKAADVGADLCKIEWNMDEDSPQNPAVIADNVGDNVGDIAGMGADLFGSFAEASCAAMLVAAQSEELHKHWTSLTIPLTMMSCGIFVCIATTFVATHMFPPEEAEQIEFSLKMQLVVSTVLMTPVAYLVCIYFLPDTHFTVNATNDIMNYDVFFCVASGLWAGLLIGFVTEYYTSHYYSPVREVAQSCETGAATNIIFGLSLGYTSVIIPVLALAVVIYISWKLADMFGIAMSAIGILSTLSIGLTIDAFGPICDNAGGIAEMAHLTPETRVRTDCLDAAGNTTAAIGKGFAIGSAALVSLALWGAFVTVIGFDVVDMLNALVVCGLLVGSMLPFAFSGMTMKSVGSAALDMVLEVRKQFSENPDLVAYVKAQDDPDDPENAAILEKFEGNPPMPDYKKCVEISTKASIREMIAPGILVIGTPLVVGWLFGVRCLAGLLMGSMISGVQMAISMSNSGGAWDNAKKYVEGGNVRDNDGKVQGKGTAIHANAVVGDTVGDPMKDTSGPSLNILIKLSAIVSVVFADTFPDLEDGGLIIQMFD